MNSKYDIPTLDKQELQAEREFLYSWNKEFGTDSLIDLLANKVVFLSKACKEHRKVIKEMIANGKV